jgi:hypothetical protein
MKKIDKLKKQRYDISMRIISLEAGAKSHKLKANQQKELEILKEKEQQLDDEIKRRAAEGE